METIKLQDKLQEIKDEVAVKHGYIHWKKLMYSMGRSAIEQYENEAMIAFAAYCCERQRESDAEAAETKTVNPGYMEMDVVDKSSILNNKLITDEWKHEDGLVKYEKIVSTSQSPFLDKHEKYIEINGEKLAPITYKGVSFTGYNVTTSGKVFTLKRGKIMERKQNVVHGSGYLTVTLFHNKARYYCLVHRLVAEMFIDNPQNKPEVNHIDGVKTNNDISNLEWATASENIQHAYKIGLMAPSQGVKLNKEQVFEIKKLLNERVKAVDIAGMFGVTKQTVSNIKHGRSHKNLDFPEGTTTNLI